jgi:hypothetical protein
MSGPNNTTKIQDDLPYGLSVDWIIAIGRHSVSLMDKHQSGGTEPTLFGLKAQAALPNHYKHNPHPPNTSNNNNNYSNTNNSLAGRKTNTNDQELMFVRDQKNQNNRSSVFLLSPRPLRSPTNAPSSWHPTTTLTTPNQDQKSQHRSQLMISSSPSFRIDTDQNTDPKKQRQKKEQEQEQEQKGTEKKEDQIEPTEEEETPNNEQTQPEIVQITPRVEALHAIFSDFDIDGDGGIDFGELVTMLDHLRERSCLYHENEEKEYTMEEFNAEEAKKVMSALDADENGTVEEIEWTNWVGEGLAHPDIRKRLVATGTALSHKLKLLLDAVEIISDAWIQEEINSQRRRKSWYDHPDDKQETKETKEKDPQRIVVAAKPDDVKTCANALHNLVSLSHLNVATLTTFFVENSTIDATTQQPATDLLARASCQLDDEGHHMCALHILVWHADFKPDMLRVFFEYAGVGAVHVSILLCDLFVCLYMKSYVFVVQINRIDLYCFFLHAHRSKTGMVAHLLRIC